MNLLYITVGTTSHYVLVENLKRLVSSQYGNNYHKNYIFQCCFHGFTSEEVFKNNLERCKLHRSQRIKVLKADNKKGRDIVKFSKTVYQLHLPFVMNADFERVLRKQDSWEPRHQNPSPPNTSITSHMGAAFTWNAVMSKNLNHPKWI